MQTQQIPTVPPLHTSHVDEDSATFRSRTFLVRYAHEIYDLNDGVHFRLTLPDTDISLFHGINKPITAPEPVTLLLEMYHSDFAKGEEVGVAAHNDHPSYDPDNVVPENPTFTPIASQTLKIPQFSSGLQLYYPIHFERSSYVQLDMMVHLAATAIRIEHICFEEEEDISTTDNLSASSVSTTGITTVSTVGNDDNEVDNTSQTVFTVAGTVVRRGPETTKIDTAHVPVQTTMQMLTRKMSKLSRYRPGEGKFRSAMARKLSLGSVSSPAPKTSSSSSSSSSPSSPPTAQHTVDSNGEDVSPHNNDANPNVTRPTRLSISTTATSFSSSCGFSRSEMEDLYEKLYRVSRKFTEIIR